MMRPLCTTEQIRELDRRTIEDDGLPGASLMENAGRAVAAEILQRFDDLGGGEVVILIGKGNNGGDGLVCARHLLGAGVEPLLFKLGDPAELTGDAALNWRVWSAGGRGAFVIEDEADLLELESALERAVVVVDALLGVGVGGPPRGLFGPVIELINSAGRSGASVVAVDLPSGLDADGGAVLAVEADLTVTFAAPKVGLFLPPGYRLCGEVVTAAIGMLPESFAGLDLFLSEAADAAAFFTPPPVDTHKGGRGRVAVLAGSRDYSGAAGLTGLGAARGGAGLVELCTTTAALLLVKPGRFGLISRELPDEGGRISPFGSETALAALNAADAAVIGPGLGDDVNVGKALRAVLPHLEVPAVIDADGLNNVDLELLAGLEMPRIITPHPGEAARLLGVAASSINEDRLGYARKLAQRSGAVCLLKGYRSIIAAPGGSACFNTTGGWSLAVGGSGDVLAGLIGALLARGVEPFSAAVAAAWLHGSAGEYAAAARGAWSAGPEDTLEHLAAAIASARRGEET
ncbi:MAG: NAD(P)H-hydrate dehydratase [Candidatus Coatesbacteria bacterium]|nr:NAD(P)H-hydrate dehydratase [Candidatus Coatesbacteria bacterium]